MRKSTYNDGRPAAADGRYPHFLGSCSPGQPINRMIGLGVDGKTWSRGDGESPLTETLELWRAVYVWRNGTSWHEQCIKSGSDVTDFWSWIDKEAHLPGTIYVVCYGAERVWPLIGLWEELISGRARVRPGPKTGVDLDGRAHRDIGPGCFVTDGPPNIAQLRIGTNPGSVVMLDLRNYGVEIDGSEPHTTAFALRAVQIFTGLADTVHISSGSHLGHTASSTANRIWRGDSVPEGVHCHVDPVALQLESDAHVGGRCECFRLGKLPGEWWAYDIRSCYGWAMATKELPIALSDVRASCSSDYGFGDDDYSCQLARVLIDTPSPRYPCCRDGKVIYPIGRFETTLCGPELAAAIASGHVVRCHEQARYVMDTSMQPVARRLYNMRSLAEHNNDKPLAQFAKTALVALAGRLGQRARWWQTNHAAVAPGLWGEWDVINKDGQIIHRRAIAGVVQDAVDGGYAPEAVPAMACWIQSYARMRLQAAIDLVGRENVAYCDTDSIVVNATGNEIMAAKCSGIDSRLGDWTLRAGPAALETRGIKYYFHGEDYRRAGLARGLYVESADGGHHWYLPSVSERLRRGEQADSPAWCDALPPAAEYKHGVVGKDGCVTPIRLEE